MACFSLLTGMECDNLFIFHKTRRQIHGCDIDMGEQVLDFCLSDMNNLDLTTGYKLGKKAKDWSRGIIARKWRKGYFRDELMVDINDKSQELLVFRCPCRNHAGLGKQCSVPIIAIDFVKYYFEATHIYGKLCHKLNLKKRELAVLSQKWIYCQIPTCKYSTSGYAAKRLDCPDCGEIKRCTTCNKIHTGFTCNQYEKLKSMRKSHDIGYLKHCKLCPGCLAPCDKIEGCDHMECINCRTHFCWICREKIGFNPYGDHLVIDKNEEWICKKLLNLSQADLEKQHLKQISFMFA